MFTIPKVKKNNSRGGSLDIAPPEDLSVSYKCLLNPVIAAYDLTLELQTSIDIIVIRTRVTLDFVETDIGK